MPAFIPLLWVDNNKQLGPQASRQQTSRITLLREFAGEPPAVPVKSEAATAVFGVGTNYLHIGFLAARKVPPTVPRNAPASIDNHPIAIPVAQDSPGELSPSFTAMKIAAAAK